MLPQRMSRCSPGWYGEPSPRPLTAPLLEEAAAEHKPMARIPTRLSIDSSYSERSLYSLYEPSDSSDAECCRCDECHNSFLCLLDAVGVRVVEALVCTYEDCCLYLFACHRDRGGRAKAWREAQARKRA